MRGATGRGPSQIQIRRPESAAPSRFAARVLRAERRENQKVAEPRPLRPGQSVGGGAEQPGGPAAQSFQIALQRLRRTGGGQIRILDAGREQFIHREYYTPAKRIAAVIGN